MVIKECKFSSVIRVIEYDPIRMELFVETKDGRRYPYYNVPTEEAQAFMDAPSKGKYWNEFRRNR